MTDAANRLAAALAGRYRVERELGQGGMSTVYLARDLKHDRDVAIKVLREDLAASLGGERFLREIKIAAQLQHPNILPLLDSGEAGGLLYFVMPYVQGQSLRERLEREGELPVHETVRLVTEVVDALATAHAMGVVHRDIKPDNVMLSGRHALVTDFGVAKAVSEATGRSTVTSIGVALGTPAYMSPEQAAADPHVDHRSDIYSVGVMAYEMLCGQPPFTGTTTQQVLAAQITEAPEPPSKRRDAISPALEQVILTCLAKRAADRYQTAEELLAALEPLATPSTGSTPASTRPMAPTRKRPWWAIGIAAAAVVVVAGVFAWRHRAAAPSAPVALDRVQLTTSGYAYSPVVSPDGKQVVYTEFPCAAAMAPPCFQRLVVQDVATGARLVLVDSALGTVPLAWSASGEWILAYIAKGGETSRIAPSVISHLGGTPVQLDGWMASFTPRGDTVLVATTLGASRGGRDPVKVYVAPWTRAVDSLTVQAPDSVAILSGLAVSPDGRWIELSWQAPQSFSIVDRHGRQVASRAAQGGVWNAAGTALLAPTRVHGGQGALVRTRVDPHTGALGASDTIPISPNAHDFSRSADGAVAAYTEQTAGPKDLWTLAAAAPGRVPQVARKVMSGVSLNGGDITPDGSTVLYRLKTAAGAQLAEQFFATPFAGGGGGGGGRAVTPPIHDLAGYAITGDSRRLVVLTRDAQAGSQLTSYDIATGRVTATAQRPDTGAKLGSAGGGDVALSAGHAITILDDSLRVVRRVAVADSLLGEVLGSPHATGLTVVGIPAALHLGPDGNLHVSIDTLTAAGGLRPGWTLAALNWGSFCWERDGSMLVTAATAADFPAHSVYRLPPGGGAQERVGPVPMPHGNLEFSADCRRAVALVAPEVSDVWLLRNFTPAMR